MFKINIFSRHPSHNILRKNLPKLNVRSLVRFGSISKIKDNKKRIEINSIESIKISSNKKLMKEAFNRVEVLTPNWTSSKNINELKQDIDNEKIKYPIVAKHIFGSRGTGNTLIKNKDDLDKWNNNKNYNNYIFESYMNYLLEYRLHITKNGCFYACRKGLKIDTPNEEKWHRHVDNSIWFLENNENFYKPNSWDDIINDCKRALIEIGADILCFDVRVQSSKNKNGKNRKYQNFILIESNSAPSMKSPSNMEISICASKYLEEIPKLIMEKNEI